jgi:hypothetical protein
VVYAGQAGDGAQQSAFAAAARPKQYKEFAIAYVQRDVIHDWRALITLGDLIERDRHAYM